MIPYALENLIDSKGDIYFEIDFPNYFYLNERKCTYGYLQAKSGSSAGTFEHSVKSEIPLNSNNTVLYYFYVYTIIPSQVSFLRIVRDFFF